MKLSNYVLNLKAIIHIGEWPKYGFIIQHHIYRYFMLFTNFKGFLFFLFPLFFFFLPLPPPHGSKQDQISSKNGFTAQGKRKET